MKICIFNQGAEYSEDHCYEHTCASGELHQFRHVRRNMLSYIVLIYSKGAVISHFTVCVYVYETGNSSHLCMDHAMADISNLGSLLITMIICFFTAIL